MAIPTNEETPVNGIKIRRDIFTAAALSILGTCATGLAVWAWSLTAQVSHLQDKLEEVKTDIERIDQRGSAGVRSEIERVQREQAIQDRQIGINSQRLTFIEEMLKDIRSEQRRR